MLKARNPASRLHPQVLLFAFQDTYTEELFPGLRLSKQLLKPRAITLDQFRRLSSKHGKGLLLRLGGEARRAKGECTSLLPFRILTPCSCSEWCPVTIVSSPGAAFLLPSHTHIASRNVFCGGGLGRQPRDQRGSATVGAVPLLFVYNMKF
ncbi:hypothetical protein FB45DRAFT_922597 [Roridomyces roridus]|uniref:Uncharacterized protein n=1 Tax=Roridomyces roridus TaxID=1738132 RepID=A0AAD7FL08_9AGAR|nr:hypothetical protein FB45DRAFT_922597 [Roridomyces roridus]